MDYMSLLVELDDPGNIEHPAGFDYREAEAKFQKVVDALSKATGLPLNVETGVMIQDASFHSHIYIPLEGKQWASVRFSNFGDMVAILSDGVVPEELLRKVRRVLMEYHYREIPLEVLEGPYTGACPRSYGAIPDWWHRFFDYM